MNKTVFQKILAVVATILAILGFYTGGKALGIDVVAELAPVVATAILGLIVNYASKWFNVKLDIINNEFTKGKIIEAIVWAENKAVEAWKIDKTILDGVDKLRMATSKVVASLPNINEEKASELIDYHFAQIRPELVELWLKLGDETKIKKALKKA